MSYVTGNTIKTLREKHRITQKALAEKINVELSIFVQSLNPQN